MAQDIIIFEGPAGSGKSTVIDALHREGWLAIPPTVLNDIPRPRSYDTPDSGASLSLVKDLARLAELIADSSPVVAMDRGFLSQRVYHTVRGGSLSGFKKSLRMLQEDTFSLFTALRAEYRHRLFRADILQEQGAKLSMVIVLPHLQDLIRRRTQNRIEHLRAYPYDAAEEHTLYHMAATQLVDSEDARHFVLPVTLITGLEDLPRLKEWHGTLYRPASY